MKKLLAIMLSVLLLCSAIPFAAVSAADEPTIVVSTVSGKVGETVEVTVSLKNNPGIISTQIMVDYDATALKLLAKPTAGEDYPAGSFSWSKKLTDIPYVINFCDGIAEANYTGELLVTMSFEILEGAAAGTYPLTVVYDQPNTFDIDFVDVVFATADGAVNVVADEPATPDEPVYTEPTIAISNGKGEAGDTVDVTVSLKNNPGIISTQIMVDYDATALKLLAKPTAGEDYPAGSFSWSKKLTDIPYVINFCDGIAEANYTGELLVTMSFEILEGAAAGTYPLTVVYDQPNTFDIDFVDVVFATANGSITVEGAEIPEIPCEHEYDADCDPVCNLCGASRPVHTEGLVHIDAVEPGCHYIGNIEYWYCAKCETFWADEALTQITNSKNVILPALKDTADYVAAKDPSCNDYGNVEYWHCDECDQYWADEALTQLTNRKNVLIDVVDHNVVHFDAAAPGCHYIGNIEYWFCTECEIFWADEALTQITNSKSVILPAIGGDVDHIAAKTPTCTENGNIEYWHCAECDQYWQNEALTQLTNAKNVVLGASCKYNAVHTEGIEAGCHYTGRVENWYCANCDVYYLDADCTIITNYKNLTIPALKDSADYVAAKDATCTENGNVEYWYCAECEQVWTDEALTQLSNLKNVQIAPSCKYNAVHNEAIAPGCHYIGRVENWYCANCDVYYLDADCTQVTNAKNVIIPALKDTADYVAAKTPSCTENGNVEYWTCAECEQVWTDEALTQLSNIKNVTLAASCKYNAVHTEGVAATCTENGLIENWYCANCDVYYLDADCTIITNAKNLVLVASCKYNAVHTEGIEPGCHYTGWTENWYCANCDVYYLDADCTIITNYKNLVIPALGSENLQHVAYKAPTATENGNIEYWFCPDCEQYWQDEALTQLTNAKNVIIPATGEVEEPETPEKPETPDSPVTGESSVAVVVALLALIASGVAVVLLKDKKRA